ncbi:MAG: HAMP domain-containing histidine kinase [Bryobacterales bacterium]|nr:HAMP domain-containing histidine kinase [Bryobacterales bacterium]
MKRDCSADGRLRLLLLLVAVMALPVCGVAWLSWKVVEQDRLVDRQRRQERCDTVAEAAVAEVGRRALELERDLQRFERGESAGGAAFLLGSGDRLIRAGGERLAFYAALPSEGRIPEGAFAAAERLEFAAKQPRAAAAAYQDLAELGPAEARAEAWLRVARCWRQAGRPKDALSAYARLEREGAAPAAGEPAEMLAWFGAGEVYAELGQREDAARQASRIAEALRARRWLLTRTSYEWMRQRCEEWLARRVDDDPAMAEAAEAGWVRTDPGREVIRAGGGLFLAVRSGTGGLAVVNASRLLPAGPEGITLALDHPNGGVRAVRSAEAHGLALTIYALAGDPAGGLSAQAKLVLAALGLMTLFTLAGGYWATRLVNKELAVARLQSDFVAAVSHEFRSPVTALMQMSEMLVRGRISSDERRGQFYENMLAESKRLHRLVENLLNFGRLETGRYEYRFEELDLGGLAGVVADEFRGEAARQEHELELRVEQETAVVRGDREALGRVVWNLLDNAVKYSPGRKMVWLEVGRRENEVTLSVRDEGLGIAVDERAEIFRKFVRGAAAREQSIRGTGVGLALSRMAVEAHGGRIEVESKLGEGSTFRVVLPLKGAGDGTHSGG